MHLSKHKMCIAAYILAAAIAMSTITGCANRTASVEPTEQPAELTQQENAKPIITAFETPAFFAPPLDPEASENPIEVSADAHAEETPDALAEMPQNTPLAVEQDPNDKTYAASQRNIPDADGFYPIDNKKGYVDETNVNFRVRPSTDADVHEKLQKGTEVNVTGENADWYRVSYNNLKGYIAKPYLKVDGQAPMPNAPNSDKFENVSNKDAFVNQSIVNLRKEPSTDSEVVDKLSYGMAVTVTGESPDWYRVTSGKKKGYVKKPYLTYGTIEPTAAPTSKPTPTPSGNNAGFENVDNMAAYVNVQRVNFRSEPNTDSNVIKMLSYGTEVCIVARSSDWYRCTYGEKTGYIAKKYLTIGKPDTSDPTAAPNNNGHQFTDYEIHLVAALCHLEGPGSTYRGYRAIASIVYNRVMNKSGHFPNTVKAVLLQKNQFGNRSLWLFENTQPNAEAQAAAEYVFRTHGSTLPPKVLFYRAVWCGIPWYDFTEYYTTIEANNYYYGTMYY